MSSRVGNFLRWIPVLLIVVKAVWDYHTYVFLFCLQNVQEVAAQIALLVIYHILFGFCVWCYLATLFSRYRTPSVEFHVPSKKWTAFVQSIPFGEKEEYFMDVRRTLDIRTTGTRARFEQPSYCQTCELIKPDRCHHCSRCSSCILKMDHHCPWVNRCVGFHNYKFFILFVFYVFVYCVFLIATSANFLINLAIDSNANKNETDPAESILKINLSATLQNSTPTFADRTVPTYQWAQILGVAFLNLATMASLFPLAKLHFRLLFNNCTTLEHFIPNAHVGDIPDIRLFDLGTKRDNFKEVFGDKVWLWFLPLYSSKGDGHHFPIRAKDTLSQMDKLFYSRPSRFEDFLNTSDEL